MKTLLFLYQAFKIFVMFKIKMFIKEEYNVDNISLKKIHMKISKLRMNRANLLIR